MFGAAADRRRSRTGLRRWPSGPGRTARGRARRSRASRSRRTCRRRGARHEARASRPRSATTTCTCPRIRPARWSGRVIAEYLRPWVPPEAHVLEIGAGYCCWINAVRAARRVAVDSWPDMPRHAAAGVEAVVLDASTGLRRFADGSLRRRARLERDRALRAGGRRGHRRARSCALLRDGGRADRDPAELPLRLSALLRRLHAPLDVHPRVARRTCCARRDARCCRSSRGSCPTRCARAGCR